MRVLVLLEQNRVGLAVDRDVGRESVRLGNLLNRFKKSAAPGERERLPRAVWPQGFDGHSALYGRDLLRFVVIMSGMSRLMTVGVAMAVAMTCFPAAQNPRARDID